jgi:site-specific DNA-methyltransferase (adenine-specific)
MKEERKTKIARIRNDGRWHSRGSNWATPRELFDELNKEFHFTLDPAASEWNAKCKKYYTEKDDGLMQDWTKDVVFLNPPYGKVLNNWMKKAYESALGGATVVCLVPSATDTKWWHNYVSSGEVRFLRGRPRFLTKEGNWQQTFSPSVIVIFDPRKMCKCLYYETMKYIPCVHNKICPCFQKEDFLKKKEK